MQLWRWFWKPRLLWSLKFSPLAPNDRSSSVRSVSSAQFSVSWSRSWRAGKGDPETGRKRGDAGGPAPEDCEASDLTLSRFAEGRPGLRTQKLHVLITTGPLNWLLSDSRRDHGQNLIGSLFSALSEKFENIIVQDYIITLPAYTILQEGIFLGIFFVEGGIYGLVSSDLWGRFFCFFPKRILSACARSSEWDGWWAIC